MSSDDQRLGYFDIRVSMDESRPSSPRDTHVRFPQQLEEWIQSSREASLRPQDDEPPEPPLRRKRLIAYFHKRFPGRIVRRVLKCALAYFVATLFTLIHPVALALGRAPFLVATGMLFSHPGRTMGAQVDTTIMSVTGIGLAILYGFAGLAASVSYNTSHSDYKTNPVGLTANAVFLLCGVFGAQLLRQTWPKFFFFSLQFMIVQIFTFTMGVNEVRLPYMLPVDFGIALMLGCGVSLVINLLIWPETAMDGLGRALRDTMLSSKDMLDMITKQFFLDPQVELLPSDTIDEAADTMRKNINKVRTAYKEAKYELSYTRVRPQEMLNIRKSLERITKHLGALSRSLHVERELFEGILTSLQYSDEEDNDDEDLHQQSSDSLRRVALTRRSKSFSSTSSTVDEDDHQLPVSPFRTFLDLPNRLSLQPPSAPSKPKKWIESDDKGLLFTYLESLRDPLTSLSTKCVNVLSCVCQSMSKKLDTEKMDAPVFCGRSNKNRRDEEAASATSEKAKYHDPEHCTCADDMVESLKEFDAAEKDRIRALYDSSESASGEQLIDMTIREELFLVFFFIFTIREITKELEQMARGMEELMKRHDKKRLYMPRLTSRWLRKWASWNNHQSTRDKGGMSHSVLAQYTEEKPPKTDMREEYRLANMRPHKSTKASINVLKLTQTRGTARSCRPSSIGSSQSNGSERMRRRSSTVLMDLEKQLTFVSTRPASDGVADNSLFKTKTAKPPLFLRIRYSIWIFLRWLKKYEVKFAAKTAIGVTLLCIPAFVPTSAAWFLQEKGQWAAITVVTIMNPTSGGTLQLGAWRVVGTVIGALVGWAALETRGGSAYMLGLFAVLLAVPFFYIHLASTYNKVGIVVLITYVAVALARYSQLVHKDTGKDTATDTAWKRMLTVIVGIIVAMILNMLVWPFIARHATRQSVSNIASRLGEYHNFLVGTFLYHDPNIIPSGSDIIKSLKMENKIQASITTTSMLLELTDHEPRLKGPFPKEIYHNMIDSCQAILDNLGSIRVALIEMPWVVKMDICSQQHYMLRRDMIASLMIHFYAVSSSLASKVPLPPYLPSMRAARVRVIDQRRNTSSSDERWVKFRNLSWYAMASCSEEIINELEHLTTLVRVILGETRYAERAKNLDERLIPDDRM